MDRQEKIIIQMPTTNELLYKVLEQQEQIKTDITLLKSYLHSDKNTNKAGLVEEVQELKVEVQNLRNNMTKLAATIGGGTAVLIIFCKWLLSKIIF